MLGCDTDIHSMQPGLPEGSLVSLLCPVSCEACHRTGMGKWIETAAVCPWKSFDDRLNEVSEVCCGVNDPDAACPRGAPPRQCSPMCAVAFHALMMDCGETLTSLAGRVNGARLAAFDQLCTSEESVDPMFFLDAIANAECSFCVGDGCIKGVTESGEVGCVYADDSVGPPRCNDGRALHLPGHTTDQYARVQPYSFPEPPFTVEGWVKVPNPEGGDHFIFSYAAGTDNCILVRSGSFPNNQWVQWVMKVERSRSITHYVDGANTPGLIYTDSFCGNQGGSMVLGQDQDNVGGGFDGGQAAEVYYASLRVFEGALTESQITTLRQGEGVLNEIVNEWCFGDEGGASAGSAPIEIHGGFVEDQGFGEISDESRKPIAHVAELLQNSLSRTGCGRFDLQVLVRGVRPRQLCCVRRPPRLRRRAGRGMRLERGAQRVHAAVNLHFDTPTTCHHAII